jgi:glycosyltransferase involved in cell wall biosynthesis
MRLKVLSVAYPFAPAGPDAVGGAEQVLSHLDAVLVRAGHRSIVVASEGSRTAGELFATPLPSGEIDDAMRARVHQEHLENVRRAVCTHEIDVVHMHGIDFHAYLPPRGVPTLVTLHLPPSWYPEAVFRLDRPDTFLHCVSRFQQSACPPCPNLLDPIENGVPVDRLPARCSKRGFALALGRVCPEKNFHVALDSGRRAGIPVLLGGEVFPYEAHQRYFRENIEPRLDRARRFLGPLGFERKRRLLSAAKCLLQPSLAPETSSLVAMEALACGTPVVAFPSGALPEIVEHGKTGFVVQNEQEMADAIRAVDAIDPEGCREAARRRFSLERMTAQYLSVYGRLARAHQGGLPISCRLAVAQPD